MKPNIKLLKRLRTRFLRMRHPEHFNMEVVVAKTACGAAMCIAGHVLDLQGYKFEFGGEHDEATVYIAPSGRRTLDALRAAAKELGIDYNIEGFDLFHDFSLRTPKQAAARIGELIEQYSQ